MQAVVSKYEDLPDNPNNLERCKILGIAYHNLAVQKVHGASEKSERYLTVYRTQYPTDNIALAFLGSAVTMAARDSWNFLTKLSEVNRGLNLLDQAISQDPDNIIIRLIRGHNALNLPSFLNRKHIAKQDFLAAEKLVSTGKITLDPDTEANIYYQLGIISKLEQQTTLAKSYFAKAIALSPSTTAGLAAKKEI
jgi:tetratricopeptide (TPR) repeat protein